MCTLANYKPHATLIAYEMHKWKHLYGQVKLIKFLKLIGKAIGSLETTLILMQKLDSVYLAYSYQNTN